MIKSVDFNKLYKQFPHLKKQPISRRILLENVVRKDQKSPHREETIEALVYGGPTEIEFWPSRIIMQDYAGMPALIDLAALRSAAKDMGADPNSINPQVPVTLVVDHSVMANETRRVDALEINLKDEFRTNVERYTFLKWASKAFKNLQIVPPGQGIIHQVNTEHFATIVTEKTHHGTPWQYPDTLIGTDSHTTMVNGMGVLGWGVGGIEAESVMLGEPISMVAPEVVTVWLEGEAAKGVLATDIVLSLTEMLRKQGVVGKIIEFCGPGVNSLSTTDRLTISNMSPEFGSMAAFFPVDNKTLGYLTTTGRSRYQNKLVENYLTKNSLFYSPEFQPETDFQLSFNLNDVNRIIAGPKRPDEKRNLHEVPKALYELGVRKDHKNSEFLSSGDIVIAAITSCTNTANPEAMITAGLLAQNARKHGLTVKTSIKTSIAPGAKVVTSYLQNLGLLEDLSALGFNVVAYGCTTCVGNSGELTKEVLDVLEQKDILVSSILSGNRNFEGRIHPKIKANFLASPPLVIAYAIAGTMNIDLEKSPLGISKTGQPVFLHDLWPSQEAIANALHQAITSNIFIENYKTVLEGNADWETLNAPESDVFPWNSKSTYLQKPPFFELPPLFNPGRSILDRAVPLAILDDHITTDHISPVGRIPEDSPAANYLIAKSVSPQDFNAFGARRGEHEVMVRGTFTNIRLRNHLVSRAGGWTLTTPEDKETTIYDAAMTYISRKRDIILFAGKQYGAGSARDWAAKGTRLLGVKAVIAESFERIHRANLVRMGVLPLQIVGEKALFDQVELNHHSEISIEAAVNDIHPFAELKAVIINHKEEKKEFFVKAIIETDAEKDYLLSGGILPHVAMKFLSH